MAEDYAAEPPAHDVCALPLVRRVAALLDRDASRWDEGMTLPRGWEFILFTPVTRQSALRGDGHHLPDPGDGAAKVMLGGRRFRYAAPIPIGARVTRTGEVAQVVAREGRAGALTIVTRRYRTTLDDGGALAIEEEEDMIYRPAAAAAPAASAPTPTPPARVASDAERAWRPDETMLFRYSALGNNAHRIHYDLPHAQHVEGYPALVVNGGLTGLMLVELFRDHVGREPASIATRLLRPLFCGAEARLRIAAHGGAWRAWAEDASGPVAEAIVG